MSKPTLHLSALTGRVYFAATNDNGKVIGEKHGVTSDFFKVLELMFPAPTVATVTADGEDKFLVVTAPHASEIIIDGEIFVGLECEHQKLSQEDIERLGKSISSEMYDYLTSIELIGGPETIGELYSGLIKRMHLIFRDDESIKPNACETTARDVEVRDASERTAALRANKTPIEKMVCFSASDYCSATKNPDFAACWGGVERFHSELFKLLDEWLISGFEHEDTAETTEEPA